MTRRSRTLAGRTGGVLAAALLFLVAAPVRAESPYALERFGDWVLTVPKGPKGSPLLANTVPRRELARAGCVAELLERPLEEFGFSSRDGKRAVATMLKTDFACLVIQCMKSTKGIVVAMWLHADRQKGQVDTKPGRFSLSMRYLPGGKEQWLFKDATYKTESADGQLYLREFVYTPMMSQPYRIIAVIGAPWSFVGAMARHRRLRMRVPSGRNAFGDSYSDAPHAGRDITFGLSGTAEAFSRFVKLCPLVGSK